MLRVTLATRLILIAVIALTAVSIGGIAMFYWNQHFDGKDTRPAPAQLASLAHLLEMTPQDRQTGVINATTSRILTPRLEPGTDLEPTPGATPAPADVVVAYAAALAPRALTVAVPRATRSPRRLMPRLYSNALNALQFRIALASGQTLIVDSTSPIVLTRFGLPAGFGAGLFGTIVALLALVVMHRETRPIARLAAAVDRIDPSAAPVPLPAARSSAPEIRALIAAFERMQARLSQLMRARMAMMGGISHDVRTFATRLRLRVEQIPDPAERDRAVADIADMIRLLDDGLLASRSGAGELTEELIDVAELVQAEVQDRRAAAAPVTLLTDGPPASVLGDRLALRRIVANLIDNALKYGESAQLTLTTAARVTLTVDDTGPGIPPEQRDILLEPFTRLETSRNRGTGGGGLGLAIVRTLAEAHGGSIAISDAPGGGARLTLSLPRFTPG